MSAEKPSKTIQKISLLSVVLAFSGAAALCAGAVYIDAGGPYSSQVGEEITFDASSSHTSDDSQIDNYYWDWDHDGVWDECFSSSEAKHTWYSAFSGNVRLYIYTSYGVDWADAHVTVTGPENTLCITVSSNVELSLQTECGHRMGINTSTGLYEIDIPGVTMAFVSPAIGGFTAATEPAASPYGMQYRVPLCNGSCYDLILTGVETGPFDLSIQALEDGGCAEERIYQDTIAKGETIGLRVGVFCNDSNLHLACGDLAYCSEMKVDPDDKIELAARPGGRYDTTITISEETGLRPLCRVVLTCSELNGMVSTIPVSAIRFKPNGFDVPAGGTQEVVMTVDVPESFFGSATGTVTVRCGKEQKEEIDVVVRRAGLHSPIIKVVSPIYGFVGIPVEFDATGSYDPDGSIEAYCWDWDLTGVYECFDEPICEHTWNYPLNRVARLRVVDNDGNTTEQYVQVMILD